MKEIYVSTMTSGFSSDETQNPSRCGFASVGWELAEALSGVALCVLGLLLLCSTPLGSTPAWGQTGTIEGQAINAENEEPLPGVNIVIEGTQLGAATDNQGNYQIAEVEAGTYDLRASFVGFQDQLVEGVEVQAGEVTEVNFALQPSQAGLDELVVVGYGTQQRRDVTGAISSISAEEIELQPVNSVDQVLQGQVAGVQVTESTSQPGGGIRVRIRGQGSITSGNEPLFVIDGVPIVNDADALPGTAGNTIGPNPLAAINPKDIESIQVLKDASATAIYGARGANGVVIIETRQGREGRAMINFSSSLGVRNASKTYDVLNARQYVQLANEAGQNQGQGQLWENPGSVGEGTDWQEELYETGIKQNYQAGVRGGDQDTRYLVSGSYLDEEGITENSNFVRYSARFNLTRDVNERLQVQTNLTASRSEFATIAEGGVGQEAAVAKQAAMMIPVFPVFDEQGEYISNADSAPFSAARLENPIAFVRERQDDTRLHRILGNVRAEYAITDNLTFRASVGADVEEILRERWQGRRLVNIAEDGVANNWTRRRVNVLTDEVLEYTPSFGENHDLTVTGGFSWEQEVTNDNSIQNSNFVNEITRNDDIGAGNQTGGPDVGSSRTEWKLISGFGRFHYSFRDRYLATFTFRGDGSSKFGKNNKWGVFPSGALAWRLSEEPFIQDLSAVSNLKLRVSFGLSGNQELAPFLSLARLTSVPYAYSGTESTGFIPASLANPDLQWERSRQLNVGLDLGLWDQQVQFTADYYRKNTDNLILPVTLPSSSGFASAVQNTGTVLNTGVDLALTVNLLFGNAFSWSTSANVSTNHNEVTDLGSSSQFFGPGLNPGQSQGSVVAEGEPIGAFWGAETDGIIADEAQAEALGYGEPGDILIIDQNGDQQITEADLTVIGNPHPDWTYGWRNAFSYRGVQLSAFIQGALGNEVWNATNFELLFDDDGTNSTVERFEERWTPENRENAAFPRAGYVAPGAVEGRLEGFNTQDGSYLRLKTVTLSYSLPVDRIGLLGLGGVQNARIYVQGHNLATITGYDGPDPDVDTGGQGTINIGIDQGGLPVFREYTFGVDLTF